MILVENKCDMVDNLSETEASFQDFWSKNKFIKGLRTSSKQGINIVESMDFLIKDIIEKLEKMYSVPGRSSLRANTQEGVDRNKNIVLNKKINTDSTKNKKNCC
jgi:hypothetical protein